MCMKLITSIDAAFRRVWGVISALTTPHIGERGVEGRVQGNGPDGFAAQSFFWT
jgi:hypothetical protein